MATHRLEAIGPVGERLPEDFNVHTLEDGFYGDVEAFFYMLREGELARRWNELVACNAISDEARIKTWCNGLTGGNDGG